MTVEYSIREARLCSLHCTTLVFQNALRNSTSIQDRAKHLQWWKLWKAQFEIKLNVSGHVQIPFVWALKDSRNSLNSADLILESEMWGTSSMQQVLQEHAALMSHLTASSWLPNDHVQVSRVWKLPCSWLWSWLSNPNSHTSLAFLANLVSYLHDHFKTSQYFHSALFPYLEALPCEPSFHLAKLFLISTYLC